MSSDSISIEVIISIITLLVLLLCSALLSGTEAAFFSLTPSEKDSLKSDNSKSASILTKLLGIPKQVLATILVSNNFINVAIVIISSNIISAFIDNSPKNETIRFLLEVFGITLILLLIGEVIPKIYGTKNSLSFSKFMARPVSILNNLPPFSWIKTVLVKGSKFIQKHIQSSSQPISTDDLEQALALTKEDSISDGEQRILEGIVKFGNTEAKQIMRSRIEVNALSIDTDYKEVLAFIIKCGNSRIPVYEETFDNVIGILFIKDLLSHLNEPAEFNWKELVRKPFFVPENKKIDDLLKEFQSMKVHMAIVVDEYGGGSGIVTLEDILEEIVGDITDELDSSNITHKKVDANTFVIEGRTPLNDFYKIIDIDGHEFEEQKGESETLGGYLIENAGRILRNKETVNVGNIRLIVESSDKKRIKLVKVIIQQKID
jgi:putative hemolysin